MRTVHAAAVLTAALAMGATACAALPGAGTAKLHDPAPRAVLAATGQAAAFPVRPRRFSYLDLFPFKDMRGALAWEAAYRNGGHSPWHLRGADRQSLTSTRLSVVNLG